jgi:ferritin
VEGLRKEGAFMLPDSMLKAMNEQIQHEFYSSYLYLSMSAWCYAQGWDGMANWFRVQSLEEQAHGMKFFDHLHDRDGRIDLMMLKEPAKEWESPLALFKAAHKHEQFISSKIHALLKLAHQEDDFASMSLLNWFVDEQIEEEATASKIVQTLERLGSSGEGLVMFDKELGVRTFTLPQTSNE